MAVDFEAIRRDYPLEAIVARALKVEKAGGNKVVVCPFHPDKNPSMVLFKDQTYHCFGCAAHGDVIDFIANTQRLSISESIRFLTGGNAPVLDDADRERRERDARHREAQQRRKEENATQEARARWARALPLNGTPNGYLTRKNVAPYGCRCEGENLLVPMYGVDGLIQSVQAISPDGRRKIFHAGAPVKGATLILAPDAQGAVIVGEGFATCATVQAATGCTVIVGFSKGALLTTARYAAERFPGREIVIAADTNGVEAAEKAAKAVGGRVVVPDLQGAEGNDFNDQAGHYGLEDVAGLFLSPAAAEVAKDALGFDILDWSTSRFMGEAPPIEWLCEGTIPQGVPALLAAMGGVGKSFIALDLALEIAVAVAFGHERKVLGGKVLAQGSVLVLNAEDSKDSVHRRLARIDTGDRREKADGKVFVVPLPEVGGPMPLVAGGPGAFVKTDKFEALLQQLARLPDLKLIIIDPLQAFVTADITKDPAAGQFMWSAFAQMCARTGATVLACHHMRKDGAAKIATADDARETIRGSTALVDGARATYALWGASEEDTQRICNEAGIEPQRKRVVHGAVVKANDEHDLEIHTYIRAASGLLEDATDAGRRAANNPGGFTNGQAMEALREIDRRWVSRRPFSAASNSPDRYLGGWLQRQFKISKEVAKGQMDDWFHGEILASEMFDRKTKSVGIRVLNWPR